MALRFNWSLDSDTQRQEAASRRVLRAGQLQRYAAHFNLGSPLCL